MLQIPLSPQAEAILRERAQASGEDVVVYAARLLDEALTSRGVDELLAPFRQQVAASQVSDDDLDAFAEELRSDAWQERAPKAQDG